MYAVLTSIVRRIGLASNVSSHLPHMPMASVSSVAQQIGRPIVPNGATMPTTGKAAVMAAATTNRPTNYPYLNAPPAAPPTTITDSSSEPTTDQPRPSGNFNTAPPLVNGYAKMDVKVDEWGMSKKASMDQGIPPEMQIQTIGTTPITITPSRSVVAGGAGESTTPRPRTNQGRQGAGSRTLSVANYADDMPEEVAQRVREQRLHNRNPSVTSKPSTTPVRAGFASAEEEKQRLYESAKMRVDQVQSGAVPPQSPTPPIVSAVCDMIH